MAIVKYPISDINCVGVIKLWGQFEIPVFEALQLSTLAQVEAFLNLPGTEKWRYGSGYTDSKQSTFIIGTYKKILTECYNIYLDYSLNTVAVPAEIVKEEKFKYGNNNEYDLTITYYGRTDSNRSDIYTGRGNATTYGTASTDLNQNMISVDYQDYYRNGIKNPITSIWSFNGGMGGIFRFNDNGKYKYFRASIDISLSPTIDRGKAAIELSTAVETRGQIFFGFLKGDILTLEEIGDGNSTIVINPTNPYEPGGSSGEGGGGGSFDNESDLIADSSLPTLSSANTGFTRIYNPSLSQVQDLARYLWTDNSVIETIWNHIKQFFENPMEAIIGFNLVPVAVPNGGTKNFALMYIDTGVQMTVAASQFVDVDCGTLEVKEYYASALDYSPNTKVSCFLPFIGNVSLNTDEVMGRTLQVKYRVDICSGSCVAKIAVDGNFIYQYSGHCAINIPLSAADFSSYVNAAISVGKLVGTALAAGAGVGLAATAQDATQQTNQVITTTQITNTVRNPATGRQITAGTQTRVETRESPMDQSSTQASFSGITPQNVSNTVGQIMTSKPHVEHSGGFSGNSGYLGVRRPYLIIERPNMCMPESFQTMNGFPSMITVTLGDCTGFTRVQQVQLTGLSATNPEQAEILQLLKSGVIL